MKNFRKKLLWALVFVMMTFTLAGCSGEGIFGKKISVDADYVITFASGDSVALGLSKQLQSVILESTGLKLTVQKDDMESTTPIPEKEIIVGAVDRPAVAAAYEDLEENGWTVFAE